METESYTWIMIFVAVGGLMILFSVIYHERRDDESREVLESRLERIHNNGGIAATYKLLVDYFMQSPSSRISNFSKKHLTIEINDEYTTTELTIKPETDNMVAIYWILHVQPMGNYKTNWRFFETSTSQEEMLNKILRDLKEKNETIVIPKLNK